MAAKDLQTSGSSPRVAYLTLYNTLSAALWASILFTVISTATSHGKLTVYAAAEPRARWVQTLTLIEVIHSAVGT